ncbi:MAG: class I SAM-dependent methyltransferase [Clostridia bacterium]|nr:class I SAM-dependent methyltransferase [Clostridia bacterium]
MSKKMQEQTVAEQNREALFRTMRTAFLTAYPKIFTDVRYASDIFFQSVKLAAEYGFSFQTSLFVADMAVEIETRHKALSAAVAAWTDKETLVIELAAGLSPRRAEFAGVNYVEFDHETIVEIKKTIYQKMGFADYASGLYAVDFMDKEAFAKIMQTLGVHNYKRVVVVSEGLFWYLKRSHVQGMVDVLSSALQGVEWLWITADCPTHAEISEAEYRNVIANSSNCSPVEPFADFNDFADFFTQNGFALSAHRLREFVSPDCIYAGKFFSVSAEEVGGRMADYTDIALLKK